MPQGALWEVEHGEIKRRGSYFEPQEWTAQERLDEDIFSVRLVETFGDLVTKYGQARLPVGVSLTGGLDSRMVLACMNESPGRHPCYSFGSMYRETFDVKTAREVAEACDQQHFTSLSLWRQH